MKSGNNYHKRHRTWIDVNEVLVYEAESRRSSGAVTNYFRRLLYTPKTSKYDIAKTKITNPNSILNRTRIRIYLQPKLNIT